MKYYRLLVLTLLVALGHALHAQSDVTVVLNKTTRAMNSAMPTSVLSYVNGPMEYVSLNLINNTSSSKQVYLSFQMTTSSVINGQAGVYIGTRENESFSQVSHPITLAPGLNRMTNDDFLTHFSGRLTTNFNANNVNLNALTLPEGQYQMCVQVFDQSSNPISTDNCLTFDVCYSGSAPEFSAPMITEPVRITLSGRRTSASLNSSTPVYGYIIPTSVLTFAWTGVISNCFQANAFDYTLKFVEVYPNQNPAYAIANNPVLAAINCGHRTLYNYRYLVDRNIQFDSGHVYAMQVIATPSSSDMIANLSNDGMSEFRVFEWRGPKTTTTTRPLRPSNTINRTPTNSSTSTTDDQAQVLAGLHAPALNTPGHGAVCDASKNLEVKFLTAYHDSIVNTSYNINLYEYVGDYEATLARMPLRTSTITTEPLTDHSQVELKSIPDDWTAVMEHGLQYLLVLSSSVDYKYKETQTTTTITYIDGYPSTNRSQNTVIKVANTTFSDTLTFGWGPDTGLFVRVIPAQFVRPTNESTKDWNDSSDWNEIPKVVYDKGFRFSWVAAKNVSNLDTVLYDLYVCNLKQGKTREAAMGDTLYVKRDISETHYIDDKLRDSLKVDKKYLAYIVTRVKNGEGRYNMLNEGRSLFSTFQLEKETEVSGALDSMVSCFPDAIKELSTEVITPKADSLINNRVRIHLGQFDMIMTEAKLDASKKTYKGSGFIVWKPVFGFGGVGIRVDFDSIKINKDFAVLSGGAKGSGENNESYIKIGIGNKYTDKVDQALAFGLDKLKDVGSAKEWVELSNKLANPISEIIRSSVEGDFNLGVTSLPIAIPDEVFNGQHQYMRATINDMYFTPTTALMNLVCVFNVPEENIYIPLMATNICMTPEGLFSLQGDSNAVMSLSLAADYEIPLPDGYTLRLKKPTKLGSPSDGTYLSFTNNQFRDLSLGAELDFGGKERPGNQLLAVDMKNNGNVNPNKPVQARFNVTIKEWTDWIASIAMDPFTVEGSTDWTFVPTGKGMFYDHSSKENPAAISFPKGYFDADSTGTGNTDQAAKAGTSSDAKTQTAAGTDAKTGDAKADGDKGKDDKDKDKPKPHPEWQGFYLDEFSVLMPSSIATTFSDLNDQVDKKDSIFTYKYGVNGELSDSTVFEVKDRMAFGAQHLIIDEDGFSTDIYGRFNFKAETKKAGGWMFGLDSARVRFTKSNFTHGSVSGQIGLPLFTGKFDYSCVINTDSLEFAIKHTDSTMKLDLWLAYFKLDKTSHFTINHNFDEEKTKVDLTINGLVNIDFKNLGIDVNFAGVKVEDMHMRNFRDPKAEKDETISFDGEGDEDDFDFSIGKWSKASPQHTIGGAPSTRYGVPGAMPDAAPLEAPSAPALWSGSLGGFTFTVDKITPIMSASKDKPGYQDIGINFVGGVSLGIGGSDDGGKARSVSASAGFEIYCPVNMKTWDIGKPGGNLDSIRITTDMDMFKVDGMLGHYNERNNKDAGNGWYGSLKVTVMDQVEVKMAAGFGSADDDKGSYDWWYFEGAAVFNPGIPVGPINFSGFGGGFAYNMKLKDESILSKPTHELINGTGTSFTDKMVSSGMAFVPQRKSWQAKAGIQLALADPKTLNGDAMFTLAMEKGHFSRVLIDINAYILTGFVPGADEATATSAESKNESPLMTARAIIGYEQTEEQGHFRFSLLAKSEVDLSNLIKGAAEKFPEVKSSIDISFGGDDVDKTTNVVNTTSQSTKDRNSSKNNKFGWSAKMIIPIDFEVTHYRQDRAEERSSNGQLVKKAKKSGDVDWYFALGKPEADKRLTFSTDLDLAVIKSASTFTFYLITGNSFDYELPPIDADVAKFLFDDDDPNKQVQTSEGKINDAREAADKYKMGAFADAGGFAMGMTYRSELGFDAFLYLNATAALGFDVGLFDVNGQSCAGYDTIGKNNFYATGQIYAMLKGDVGLSLNLGFWKGKISLFSAGVGALLKGGGPNPSWAYGLLRFKVSALGGLVKLNTSCDFSVGDVCLPGAGDPLANVKLFETINPSFASMSDAKETTDRTSPYSTGNVTSNMPWSHGADAYNSYRRNEVVLVTPTTDGRDYDARCFAFVLDKSLCDHTRYYARKGGWSSQGTANTRFTFLDDDPNAFAFEDETGGFAPSKIHKFQFVGRAFEKRKLTTIAKYQSRDSIYNLSTCKPTGGRMSATSYYWGLPLYDGQPKPWHQDTVFYIRTDAASENLDNQVIFTWPYNGDPFVPYNEVKDHAYIFLFQDRGDLLDPAQLRSEGKELKVFLVNQSQSLTEGTECTYTYHGNTRTPYIDVNIKPENLKHRNSDGTFAPCYIAFIKIKTDEYNRELEAAQRQAQKYVIENQFVQNRRKSSTSVLGAILDGLETLAGGSAESGNVDLAFYQSAAQRQATDEDVASHGEDTLMSYKRVQESAMQICKRIGTPIYTLYFRLDPEYESYSEIFNAMVKDQQKNRVDISGSYSYNSDEELGTITMGDYYKQNNPTFANMAHIFSEYDPQDPHIYRTTLKQPPIATITINGMRTISRSYNDNIPGWLGRSEELAYQLHEQNTSFQTYFRDRNAGVLNNSFVSTGKSFNKLEYAMTPENRSVYAATSYTRMNANTIMDQLNRYGLYSDDSYNWGDHVVEGAPRSKVRDWFFPNILQVTTTGVRRVDSTFFKSSENLHPADFRTTSPTIKVLDYTAMATSKNNKLIFSYFQDIVSYALWYENQSSGTLDKLEKTYTSSDKINDILTVNSAPFTVRKSSMLAVKAEARYCESKLNSTNSYYRKNYFGWYKHWPRTGNPKHTKFNTKSGWSLADSPWFTYSGFTGSSYTGYSSNGGNSTQRYIVDIYYITQGSNSSAFVTYCLDLCDKIKYNANKATMPIAYYQHKVSPSYNNGSGLKYLQISFMQAWTFDTDKGMTLSFDKNDF